MTHSAFYCDSRLGGVKRYSAYKPADWDMRIPHNILNCVCFLGIRLSGGENAGKFMSLGTGFFVGLRQDDWDFLYLVTAKHVLNEAVRGGGSLEARLNKENGEFDYIKLQSPDHWIRWQDDAVDVALLPIVVDYTVFKYEALPLEMLATNAMLTEHAIGLGDDLFTVGLFTLRTGKQRNLPIIRTGVISALPDENEPLTEKGKPYHAYLAEMRSISGLSGSPVFVFIDNSRTVDPKLPAGRDWLYFCLGLIRGHWYLERDLSDDVVTPDAALGSNPGETLNVGIAVVMPSQYIVEILTSPKLQEVRQRFIQMREEKNEPTQDSVKLKKAEEVFTKESFKDALERVSRKTSESESKDSQT